MLPIEGLHQTEAGALQVTVGLDVGDRYTYFCVVDPVGATVEDGRFATTPATAERWFRSRARARVVCEVGTHSPWLSRLAAACGHEVLVANPRRLRLIAESDTKTDRCDAEFLARIGRLDPTLLTPITHRGEQTQTDLALLRARDVLVSARTQMVNHVRGAVKAVGARLPRCSTAAFAKTARPSLPPALTATLDPVLDLVERLTHDLRAYDARVEQLCAERYPETERLRQVAGVGPLTALCYVLVLEDPTRFRNSRAVGAYLGLRPRLRHSGDARPQLRITKAGDPMLRRLLVGSAHYILGRFGPPTDLQQWGMTIAAHGGRNAKKRAVVAVARKLAVLLHRLWLTGSTYVPSRTHTLPVPVAHAAAAA